MFILLVFERLFKFENQNLHLQLFASADILEIWRELNTEFEFNFSQFIYRGQNDMICFIFLPDRSIGENILRIAYGFDHFSLATQFSQFFWRDSLDDVRFCEHFWRWCICHNNSNGFLFNITIFTMIWIRLRWICGGCIRILYFQYHLFTDFGDNNLSTACVRWLEEIVGIIYG